MPSEDQIKAPPSPENSGAASPTQAEIEAKSDFPHELPQWPIRAALILLVSLIAAVIAWFFHVAPPLPSEGGSVAPKQHSGGGQTSEYQSLEKRELLLIDSYYTVTKSLRRSRDIAYNLGYDQGRIDEMTEIMEAVKQ